VRRLGAKQLRSGENDFCRAGVEVLQMKTGTENIGAQNGKRREELHSGRLSNPIGLIEPRERPNGLRRERFKRMGLIGRVGVISSMVGVVGMAKGIRLPKPVRVVRPIKGIDQEKTRRPSRAAVIAGRITVLPGNPHAAR
jgi:hypothetical protein